MNIYIQVNEAIHERVASFLMKRLGELINGSAKRAGNMVSNHGTIRKVGTNPPIEHNFQVK